MSMNIDTLTSNTSNFTTFNDNDEYMLIKLPSYISTEWHNIINSKQNELNTLHNDLDRYKRDRERKNVEHKLKQLTRIGYIDISNINNNNNKPINNKTNINNNINNNNNNNTDTDNDPTLTFHLDTDNKDIPQVCSIRRKRNARSMLIFSENKNSEPVSLLTDEQKTKLQKYNENVNQYKQRGDNTAVMECNLISTIAKSYDMHAISTYDESYKKLLQQRINQQKEHTTIAADQFRVDSNGIVQSIGSYDSLTSMNNPSALQAQALAKRAQHDYVASKQQRKTQQEKRYKHHADDVKAKLLYSFNKQPYLTMKQLLDITNEPVASLKTYLNEMCTYHQAGEHRTQYSLKHYRDIPQQPDNVDYNNTNIE